MVGVAAKSRSCDRCRSQKVRCGLQRPFCDRCLKAKSVCTGYERGLVFVNRSLANPSQSTVSVLSQLRQKQDPKISSGDTSIAQIHVFHSPSAERLQIFNAFTGLYLPQAGAHQLLSGSSAASWIQCLLSLSDRTETATTSLTAMCLSHIALLNKNDILHRKSTEMYNSALRELRLEIANPISRFREETLATIVMLTTYEIFSGPGQVGSGWASHVLGSSQLLQLWGPSIGKSLISYHLFQRARTSCVFDALRRRQSTFLADPEWRNLAPKQASSDPYNKFWDLIVDLPSILELTDQLSNEVPFKTTCPGGLRLYDSCWSLNNKLQDWHHELISEFPGLVYWLVPSSVSNPADSIAHGRVFPLSLQFESLHVAQLLLSYWTALVMLYNSMYQIYPIIKNTGSSQRSNEIAIETHKMDRTNRTLNSWCIESNNMPLTAEWYAVSPPPVEEMIRLAKYICQSTEYCYGVDKGTLGPQLTVFSIWAAKQTFLSQPGYERELAWCSEIKNMRAPHYQFDIPLIEIAGIR